MAEGDATAYNHFKEILLLGDVDLVADVIKIFLLGAGYGFTPDGNNGYADINANEITTTTGYTAGGATLTGKAVAQDDTANTANWDAANVTWTSLAATTIAHAVIYDDTVTAPVADLSFNASGILTLS
jgi:hypothetical protein